MSSKDHRPAAERQAAARDVYRASLATGVPLSGAAIGRQFDMSERWGRDRVTEVHHDASSNSDGPTVVVAVRDAGTANRDDGAGDRDAASADDAVPQHGAVAAPRDEDAGDRDAVPETTAAELAASDGGRSWLDSVVILVVAGVAAAASYGHMLEVALWAGEPLWIARAFPVTVDGLVLAALRRGATGRFWLVLGIAVSVAANMLARYPELAATAGPVVSAWPPLALYGTHRLLQGRRTRR